MHRQLVDDFLEAVAGLVVEKARGGCVAEQPDQRGHPVPGVIWDPETAGEGRDRHVPGDGHRVEEGPGVGDRVSSEEPGGLAGPRGVRHECLRGGAALGVLAALAEPRR